MTPMWLIAIAGIKVPKEENPREYITEALAVEVGVTPYYMRRLADGDLREATADETAAAQAELAKLEEAAEAAAAAPVAPVAPVAVTPAATAPAKADAKAKS